MIKYEIIYATTIDAICRELNVRLATGWNLVGGICVSGGKFYQAMTHL